MGGRPGDAGACACCGAAQPSWHHLHCPRTQQVPENPRATVLLIHGCAHSGYNYWPQSEACSECRGLPEEMSHTIQALRRGYAGEACGGGWVQQLGAGICGRAASRRSLLPPLRNIPTTPAPHTSVIAISSYDRKTGCFAFWDDFLDVKQIVEDWRKEWG